VSCLPRRLTPLAARTPGRWNRGHRPGYATISVGGKIAGTRGGSRASHGRGDPARVGMLALDCSAFLADGPGCRIRPVSRPAARLRAAPVRGREERLLAIRADDSV